MILRVYWLIFDGILLFLLFSYTFLLHFYLFVFMRRQKAESKRYILLRVHLLIYIRELYTYKYIGPIIKLLPLSNRHRPILQRQRCWKNAVGVLACIDNIPVCYRLHCDVNHIDVRHIEDAWLQLEEGSPGALSLIHI